MVISATALLLIYLGVCDFSPSHVIPTVNYAFCERLRDVLVKDPIIQKEAGQVTCLDIQMEEQQPPRQYDACCRQECWP